MVLINKASASGRLWQIKAMFRRSLHIFLVGISLIVSCLDLFAQEATANLICRFYVVSTIESYLMVEQPYAPKQENLSLIVGDGSMAEPHTDEALIGYGYIVYKDLPPGPAVLSYSFPDEKRKISVNPDFSAGFQEATHGVVLSPGDNYFFIRVLFENQTVAEIETQDDTILLPCALMSSWRGDIPARNHPDPVVEALSSVPGSGLTEVKDDRRYYLANRNALDCQIVGGNLLFSIKPEYH